jgi:dTDP-glucose 4,6-dehydratase
MAQESVRGLKAVVTGGAGFIGSELTRQLVENGADVTVLDNFLSGKMEYIRDMPVKVVKGDVCNSKVVSKCVRGQGVVYHLAALPFIPDSYVNPQEFFRANVEGSINVMWQAIRSGSVKRFVYVSTSEIYGTAQRVPMNEDHPTRPHSTYAVSKLAADRAVFTLHKEQGFPVVIIRPFNTYGPNVTQPYIIPEIVIQLLEGSGVITLGNVESSRDFTFVEDTARAILLASLSPQTIGEVINVGSGFDIKIMDLAKLIARVLGREFRFEKDDSRLRPYDVNRLICDNSKVKRLLGWEPRVALEAGLKKTIDWIQSNPISFKAPFRGCPAWYRRQRS